MRVTPMVPLPDAGRAAPPEMLSDPELSMPLGVALVTEAGFEAAQPTKIVAVPMMVRMVEACMSNLSRLEERIGE